MLFVHVEEPALKIFPGYTSDDVDQDIETAKRLHRCTYQISGLPFDDDAPPNGQSIIGPARTAYLANAPVQPRLRDISDDDRRTL